MTHKLLVVDDQADLRRLVRWTLEIIDGGVELHETNNGSTAVVMARKLRPRIVMLDVMMPGDMDGLDVCRRIRELPELAETRVVLLSARGQAKDIETGLAAGADAYVVKPFSPQHLVDVVEKMLADRPAETQAQVAKELP